jgi:riboflavin biosynthesis pyrimidine reductase
VILHRVLPDGARLTPEELLADVAPRERAPDDRPLVMMVMIATVDGRAAVGGASSALGGDADLALLLELRTIADAVLIGGATVRAEGYGRLVGSEERRARRCAAGLAEDPVAVLVSRSMDLPWDAGLFAASKQPVLVYTGAGADPPDVAAPVELVRLEEASLSAALVDLRQRGVRSVLCEGGPTLNRALLAAGLVDELFLTLSPLLTADDTAPGILAGGALPEPARLALRWVCHHEGELYLRYRL